MDSGSNTPSGANTLTFIIPAEIFPTAYRCTCHGISAAAGKIGSIVAVLIVYGVQTGYANPNRQGMLFVLFGAFMLIGAVYSWAYIPDVQRVGVLDASSGDGPAPRKRTTKTLEELGEGRAKARLEGEIITIKDKWAEIKRRRARRRSTSDG